MKPDVACVPKSFAVMRQTRKLRNSKQAQGASAMVGGNFGIHDLLEEFDYPEYAMHIFVPKVSWKLQILEYVR